jgi:excisionase family DNA binding protein
LITLFFPITQFFIPGFVGAYVIHRLRMTHTSTRRKAMDNLMMTGEVARVLERSAEMARQYVRDGKLPAIRTGNGKLLFREEDVLQFAQKLREKAGARREQGRAAQARPIE